MLYVVPTIMLMQCCIVISLINICECDSVEIFMLYVVPTIMLMKCCMNISLIKICEGYISYDNIS
jgi:hypothetical protein